MASDNAQSHPRVVRLFGNRDSAEAWAIRDFLKRSVVEFEWTELTGDEECRNALGLPSLKKVRLPVVEMPGGGHVGANEQHVRIDNERGLHADAQFRFGGMRPVTGQDQHREEY